MVVMPCIFGSAASPPSRGAWIEIKKKVSYMVAVNVAPLAGGVD